MSIYGLLVARKRHDSTSYILFHTMATPAPSVALFNDLDGMPPSEHLITAATWERVHA